MENFGFFFISFGLGYCAGFLCTKIFDSYIEDRVKEELRKREVKESDYNEW